jgi:isochorismate synthase
VTVAGRTRRKDAEARRGEGLAAAVTDLLGGRVAVPAAGPAPGLVAASVPIEPFDAVALYAAAVEAGYEAVLWLQPSEEFALVGIGRAWAVEPSGQERFRAAEASWRSLMEGARFGRLAAARGLGPVVIGGLGFSGRVPGGDDVWQPFGAAALVLPSLVALGSASGSWVTGSIAGPGDACAQADALEGIWARLSARADRLAPAGGEGAGEVPRAHLEIVHEWPTSPHWRHLVGLMAGAVGRGRLDKVVFARRVDLVSSVDLEVAGALRLLAASAPESAVFAFRRGDSTFLGATPERLVRTAGRSYSTAAVAGSIRRGADEAEDAALRAELLASEKEREEHAVVVRTIRRQLEPISETIEVAAQPSVLVLCHVQHLATAVEGTVRGDEGLLALADRLHPTPAVGGEPRHLALAMIDEHEGFDRGWYTGPVGWLGPDGDGELMVALRCGLVSGGRASLFAGCGIVADSDPDREWEESRIKMRAVAAALGRPGDEP